MAIIKCPECGHQISDKALTCPSCGVKIKDNVIRCQFCGEVYLNDQPFCPNCHKSPIQTGAPQFTTEPTNTRRPGASTQYNEGSSTSAPVDNQTTDITPGNKKRNTILAVVAAVIVILAGLYFFFGANSSLRGDEEQAYETAMTSSDIAVLEDYLNNFSDAPQAHLDSINAHLGILKQKEAEWTNAAMSNSKSILLKYIENNPNSIHKEEAVHKIDSIDWASAKRLNTAESFQAYLNEHADGEHAEEAQEFLSSQEATIVNADDKQMVSRAFQTFFSGLNNNDEMGLTSAVSSTLEFLSNSNATKSDVITFLKRLYKEGVSQVNWRGNGDFKIQKIDAGDGSYEFDVEFTADEQVSNVDQSKDKFNQYKVSGHVDKNGKISKFQLQRIG